MALIGLCPECVVEKPRSEPYERQKLYHAADGEHLCKRHHREALVEFAEGDDYR